MIFIKQPEIYAFSFNKINAAMSGRIKVNPKKEKNMDKKINCFVIIGYGKKASYANGKIRILDLQ